MRLPVCAQVGRWFLGPAWLDFMTSATSPARTVTDLVRLLDVIADVDPADRATAEADGKIPPTYMAFLKRDGAAGRRIGVLRHACRPSASDSQVLAPIRPSCRRFGSGWGRRSLILSS
jgi:Asp-tRNA(Asn)/Glu-tRNA(Gln) amidotransferase A subunit family amidase